MKDSESEKRNGEGSEENKENLNDSRAETSMSNSTFNTSFGAQRVENKEANVDDNGYLDLSNLQLTGLSRSLEKKYLTVRHLNLSSNDLRFFSYITFFKNCEKIDASDNQIQKFQTNHNLALKELLLLSNQLAYADGFNRFINLRKLDLSFNNLKDKITLSLPSLEFLNLSQNAITEVPNLSKCRNLQHLDLSNNKICSLENLTEVVNPTNLSFLSLRSNQIPNLLHFKFLYNFQKLLDVHVANNPCIDEALEEGIFDPLACVSAFCFLMNLKLIDGHEIGESTKAQGEFLNLTGKIRKFGLDEAEEMKKYLVSQFPKIVDEKELTPAQKSIRKVLQMQREESIEQAAVMEDGTTDRTANSHSSVYSPFGEWERKIENAGKSPGGIMAGTTTPTRKFSAPSATSFKKSIRVMSPPPGSRNRSMNASSTFYRGSDATIVERKKVTAPVLTRSSSTDSTATITITSARAETSISIDASETPTPVPMLRDSPQQRAPSAVDLSIREDEENTADSQKVTRLESRVAILEHQVAVLAEQNEMLTRTNVEFMETLEAFQNIFIEERQAMLENMQKMIPRPANLKASPLGDKADGTYVVRWDLPVVSGYEIWINGKKSGRVIGRNNTARVTDLDAGSRHVVQVQAIRSNDIVGELSDELHIITPSSPSSSPPAK